MARSQIKRISSLLEKIEFGQLWADGVKEFDCEDTGQRWFKEKW